MLEMLKQESTVEVSPNRVKLLRVSLDILASLLSLDGKNLVKVAGLPKDAKIVAGSFDSHFQYNEVAFRVTSAEFPEVQVGCCLEEFKLDVTVSYVEGSLTCDECQLTYLGHTLTGMRCPRCGIVPPTMNESIPLFKCDKLCVGCGDLLVGTAAAMDFCPDCAAKHAKEPCRKASDILNELMEHVVLPTHATPKNPFYLRGS